MDQYKNKQPYPKLNRKNKKTMNERKIKTLIGGLFCSLFTIFFLNLSSASAVYTLDDNFGTNGRVSYDAGDADILGGSATDSQGNVYVTGIRLDSFSGRLVLLKYNSSGNLASGFPKIYDGGHHTAGGDGGYAVYVDSSDNVYVTGITENGGGGADLILLKYDSSGNVTSGFPKTYDSGNEGAGYGDAGKGVTVDSSGNIYVSGSMENASGGRDLILLKYNSSGTLAAGFPKFYNSGNQSPDGGDSGFGITLDTDNNIYITGFSENASNSKDIILLKYDSSGNLASGFPKTYDGGHNAWGLGDAGYNISRDSAENFYITGYTETVPGEDIILLKYDSSGNLASGFPKTYDSGNEAGGYGDVGTGIALDSNGNVYISGDSENASGDTNTIFLKYSSSGDLASGYPINVGNGISVDSDIAIDQNDNLYAVNTAMSPGHSIFYASRYIVEPQTPAASPAGGSYSSSQTISLSCSTADAVIRYTLDGSTPTASSTLYSSPISVSQSLTLKAKAFKSQLSSGLMTENYVIPTNTNTNNEVANDVNSYHTPSVAVGSKKIYPLSGSLTSVNKINIAFKGTFSGLSKGKVQVFRDGTLIKTGKTNKAGEWRIKVHPKRNVLNSYQFKYFNSNNQLVETTPSYQLIVDKMKPVINLGKKINSTRGGAVTWQVTDNNAVDYCTVSFRGKRYAVSGNSFTISETAPPGLSNLRVTCYDEAKNSSSKKAEVRVE